MKSAGLTEAKIDALQPRTGAQYVAWDGRLPGFGVRVSPAGTKTYIYKYRLASGRARWATVGRVGTLSLEKARIEARGMGGDVARGQDPQREKDAAKGAVTVSDAADRFLAEHVDARRKATTGRLYRLAIDSHIRPKLGSTALADVSSDDVRKLHHRLRATPYLANRVLAVLSKLLAWGGRPGPLNPCLGIEKFPERKRKRYLDAAEYARVGKVLRANNSDVAVAPKTAIQLLLLTGARPAEIASLEWAHVDLTRAALNLPDSKTGAKTIHLSPAAVRLLKRWPRGTSDYVFPGTGRGEKQKGLHMHPSTLTHAWADIREAAGLDDVRLYDACRHSYASTAISKHGLSLVQVGAQLGHSQPATTARYAHLHDDVAKQHASTIGGSIAAALKRRTR